MTHTNNDLLNVRFGKNDFTSEHYQLNEAIQMSNRINWKKEGNSKLTPSEKRFKRELDKKFENEIIFHFTC